MRTSYVVPADDWILIAVAPGKNAIDVVGRITGNVANSTAQIPRDGFEAKLVRVGPERWRAVVRLPHPGRWRLVIPNGTHNGYIVPLSAKWMRWVTLR